MLYINYILAISCLEAIDNDLSIAEPLLAVWTLSSVPWVFSLPCHMIGSALLKNSDTALVEELICSLSDSVMSTRPP